MKQRKIYSASRKLSLPTHLTSKQSRFLEYFVEEGKTQTEATRQAGYLHPWYEGYRLLRMPSILDAIHLERQRQYQSGLANVAVKTLMEIMQDREASSSARVAAAHTAIELAGDLGKGRAEENQ